MIKEDSWLVHLYCQKPHALSSYTPISLSLSLSLHADVLRWEQICSFHPCSLHSTASLSLAASSALPRSDWLAAVSVCNETALKKHAKAAWQCINVDPSEQSVEEELPWLRMKKYLHVSLNNWSFVLIQDKALFGMLWCESFWGFYLLFLLSIRELVQCRCSTAASPATDAQTSGSENHPWPVLRQTESTFILFIYFC